MTRTLAIEYPIIYVPLRLGMVDKQELRAALCMRPNQLRTTIRYIVRHNPDIAVTYERYHRKKMISRDVAKSIVESLYPNHPVQWFIVKT